MINKLKAFFTRLANSNITLYAVARLYICRMRPFLPHEPDFAAVRLIPFDHGMFLDVGANDGLSVLSFRVFNKTARILSIEPNLHHEAALSKLKKQISEFDYLNIGAGDSEGSLNLFTPIYKGFPLTSYASLSPEVARNNLRASMHIPNIAEKVTFSETNVRVQPLDNLHLRPDFIKIDVEGFEDGVLRGLIQTLTEHKPALMVEYNPRSYAVVQDLMSRLGYQAKIFNAEASEFIPYTNQESLNIFFLHPDRMPRAAVQ